MQSGLETAFMLIVLILSVIAHEIAHGYAANALGDPTAKLQGRLTLNPLAHIDIMGSIIVPVLLVLSNQGILFGWAKPVPYNPYNLRNQRFGEAIVAFAGPATNLVLAVIFGLLVRFSLPLGLPESAADFAGLVCFINLFLGLFNLIPFPPMDGYTVLRGALPFRYTLPLRDFENNIRAWGVAGIFLVLIVFSLVFSNAFFHLVSDLFNFLIGS